jgi:hypothetical protein
MAVNKNWEDDFDESKFDCHKEAHNEWNRLRQENSTTGWIYIGVDIKRSSEVKVGETSGALGTRASSSHNPYYAPYHAFKVKEGVTHAEIKKIEHDVHEVLSRYYERINHFGSGEPTEWFKRRPSDPDNSVLTPLEIKEVVENRLLEKYTSSMDCYYDSERDMGVIKGWQNERLINNGTRAPYHPSDLSNPPVSLECLTPPGCGLDCDCW